MTFACSDTPMAAHAASEWRSPWQTPGYSVCCDTKRPTEERQCTRVDHCVRRDAVDTRRIPAEIGRILGKWRRARRQEQVMPRLRDLPDAGERADRWRDVQNVLLRQ